MRKILIFLFFFVLVASLALAADWSRLERRLNLWDGEMDLASAGELDLFGDARLSSLVDLLLERGFALLPPGQTSEGGLVLERQTLAGEELLLLRRARDGALLARQPLAPPPLTAAATPVTTAAVPPPVAAEPAAVSALPTRNLLQPTPLIDPTSVLLPLAGQPRGLAVWPAAEGGFALFLLEDAGLRQWHCDGRQLSEVAFYPVPLKVSRALSLAIGDSDGDGVPELAAVWLEDVRGVYQGTNSQVHAWLLQPRKGELVALSDDLAGYLAFDGTSWLRQQRSDYQLFEPVVEVLERTADGVRSVGQRPLTDWLYARCDGPAQGQQVVWNATGRLEVRQQGGAPRPLLLDFGLHQGAAVFVALETPEYRSGFSRDDQVLDRRYLLPRRLLPMDGALYSLIRGRSSGLPLIGSTAGQDRLVRIRSMGEQLQADEPFAPVDAFILDFALLPTASGLQAVLLLNEKEGGRGSAYLALQRQR
ncbi:MAG: hypothetical protein AB7T15_04995 [Desulfuromonas sp.]|nr:hypothetical protein [Desulfuromonas thiophila]